MIDQSRCRHQWFPMTAESCGRKKDGSWNDSNPKWNKTVKRSRSFWQHLRQIKEKRLYRETHTAFARYVEDRWGIKKTYAYDLMRASETLSKVSAIADKIPEAGQIKIEAQLRELTRMPQGNLADVVETAIAMANDQDSPVTAKVLRKARQQVTGNPAPASKNESTKKPDSVESHEAAGQVKRSCSRKLDSTRESDVSIDEKATAHHRVEVLVADLRQALQSLGLNERFDGLLSEMLSAATEVVDEPRRKSEGCLRLGTPDPRKVKRSSQENRHREAAGIVARLEDCEMSNGVLRGAI